MTLGTSTVVLCQKTELKHSGAVVKHHTRDRGVEGSIPASTKCYVLVQDTLFALLSTG